MYCVICGHKCKEIEIPNKVIPVVDYMGANVVAELELVIETQEFNRNKPSYLECSGCHTNFLFSSAYTDNRGPGDSWAITYYN
jgi:hypothetical protein